MELRQLKYFVTVAKTSSFSEAARQLFVTQGTLSQQIKQLEDEAGTPLFARNTRSVSLTEAGEALLPVAEQTIESAKLCHDTMTDLGGNASGTLNIGLTYSFGELLTDTVKSFLKKYPNVNLNIHYTSASELIRMVQDKEVDIALTFKPFKVYENIESEVLFRSRLSVIMRKEHPLAGHKALSLSDIDRQGIVLPGSGMQARRAFDEFLGTDTRTLNVRVEINDPNIIMDLVQGTNMVAIASSLAAYYRPTLTAIPFENGKYEMHGCVHHLKNSYRKRSEALFLDMLRESPIARHIDSWVY